MTKIISNGSSIFDIRRKAALFKTMTMHIKPDFLTSKKKLKEALGYYNNAFIIYDRTLAKNKRELYQLSKSYVIALNKNGNKNLA